jgi:hypothetical protein
VAVDSEVFDDAVEECEAEVWIEEPVMCGRRRSAGNDEGGLECDDAEVGGESGFE